MNMVNFYVMELQQAWIKARMRMDARLWLCLAVALTSWTVVAGSDSTFSAINDWIMNALTGSFGMLITMIGLVVGLVSALAGAFKFFLVLIGIILAAVYGGPLIEQFFTATF